MTTLAKIKDYMQKRSEMLLEEGDRDRENGALLDALVKSARRDQLRELLAMIDWLESQEGPRVWEPESPRWEPIHFGAESGSALCSGKPKPFHQLTNDRDLVGCERCRRCLR